MANIKELLASMIGKINGKLNAPEQAAQPHQQLVTDSNGVAKWEDRTHYATRDESVLIERQTLNFEYQAGSELYFATLSDTGIQFESDKIYIVEWDGDVHSVHSIEVFASGMTMVVLGNAALMNAVSGGNFDDTGETFCIGKTPPEIGDVVQFFTSDTSNTHAVKVSAVTETIKTIDPEYTATAVMRDTNYANLISGIAPASAESAVEAVEFECINMTFGEAIALFQSGVPLRMMVMAAYENGPLLLFDNFSVNPTIQYSRGVDSWYIFFDYAGNTYYWSVEGISTERP